ncbi:HEAT repeat protein [Aquabacterium commune]|uniref:HEAT repeat protein n=1 Tax=Aquabacterium commune TaxID=70586 RepID=A0A4R6R5U0_9BURK|nr:HEAT repeat domain-containing protein [Aquabacterium commune]TDP81273.1 HEAT repeat protein [Aquabacterium commune]
MGLRKATEHGGLRRIEPREYTRDTEGLVAQLQDADPSVRRWAARDLAIHPQAVSALCAHLAHEPDHSVRQVIFTTLGCLGGGDVAAGLIPLLRSEDPGLRNGAIEALSELPEDVAPHIESLLRDANTDVRIFTLNLMTDLKHPDVNAWLARVLMEDHHVNVVAAALELLAEIGTHAALPALNVARQRFADDAFIGFAADLAQQRIEAP